MCEPVTCLVDLGQNGIPIDEEPAGSVDVDRARAVVGYRMSREEIAAVITAWNALDDLTKSLGIEWFFEIGIGATGLEFRRVKLHKAAPNEHDRNAGQFGVGLNITANIVAIFFLKDNVGKNNIGFYFLGYLFNINSDIDGRHLDCKILQSQLKNFLNGTTFISE